jgi:O-antigen/teichoic acid export membrane protein
MTNVESITQPSGEGSKPAILSVRGAAIWAMGGQYVGFTIQFVVSVIISRYYLLPAEVGVYSIALSAAMLVAVLQDFGIARYVSGQPNLSDDEIRTCFSVSILFALVIGLLIFAMAWPLAHFYGEPQLFILMTIVAVSYVAVPFGIVPNALLARRMDFKSLFIVNVGGAVANGAIALMLAALGYSALSLAWALVAQAAVRAVLGQWLSKTPVPLPFTLTGALPILKFGSASSLLFVSGSIGTRSPELIVGRMITLTAVGLYGRATSLAVQLHTLVAGAVGGVFYPAFRRLRDEGAALDGPYLRVVGAYSGVVWPAMVGLAVAAEPLVHLLYGLRWAGVAPLLRWIALSEIFFVALPLHVELPILLGRIGSLIRYNFVDTFASIGLLMLGAWISLEWAALSRIGYGILWFAIYAHFVQGLVGFRWTAMLRIYAQSAAVAGAAVAPLLVAYALGVDPAMMTFSTLLFLCGAGVLCWVAALAMIRHPVFDELIDMGRGVHSQFAAKRSR